MNTDRFLACWEFVNRPDTDGQGAHLDPHDRGGWTNRSVTLGTFTGWRVSHGKPIPTPSDLAAASQAELQEIARAWYWAPVRGDALPAGVDLMAFDIAIGSGAGIGARVLQRPAGVAVDGHVGPVTLAAVARRPVQQMILAMNAGWLEHCRAIPDPGGWPTYHNGWTNRALKRAQAAMGMAGCKGAYAAVG